MMATTLRRSSHNFCLFGIVALLGIAQRSDGQQPFRSGLPARPSVNVPQPSNTRSAPNNNNRPIANITNNRGFENSGFSPQSRSNRNFNDCGYNSWNSWGYNDWNGWNSFSNPYANSFANFNGFNPAMNGFWNLSNWQAWNVNPYVMNANMYWMWNNFGANPMMANYFGMNPMWNNFNMNFGYNPFAMMGGMPVSNWNGFNPAMLIPNLGAANQDVPR